MREDLTGSFSEAGAALTMRYRRVTMKPGQRCDTGWVRARASLLRYTAKTPDGVAVGFDVKDRMTLMTGELVPNLEGTVSGVVPGCKTPDAELPEVAKRWTGVSGQVDERGSVQLSTEFPIALLSSPVGARRRRTQPGSSWPSGLPEESDRYFPWSTGPAQITGTLGLGWVGTAEGCESTRTQVVLERTHPELALTLPRPGTREAHGAR